MRTLLVLLLVATAARAQEGEDACLTGASALADERQIAALRALAEESCPCASFTGGRGANRGAYQVCAKRLLTVALADGRLREACKATMRALNRGAVCGSPRAVPCGRVATRRGEVVPSCRLQVPARCTDARRADAEACTGATHCADVVTWTAGTCLDPRAPGPYAVGYRILRLVKKSVLDPDADRTLDTVVWYPATTDGTPDATYRGVADAPLATAGAPYPLLVFSHGSCGYASQSTFLTALLASWGFVVASPPHPGNTLAEFPACGTPQAQVGSAAERPADVRFVLDQMVALAPDSPLAGAVDPARAGMAGHSFGGFTTYLAVPGEPRFKVAMPLAPAVPGQPVLSVPSLTMLGAIDGVVDNDAIRDAYARAEPPKLLVSVQDAGHYAFSDLCFPSADCMPPVTRSQVEAHEQVVRWAVPFLQVYLAGDERFRPLLEAAATPGVTVERMR